MSFLCRNCPVTLRFDKNEDQVVMCVDGLKDKMKCQLGVDTIGF
jgi:hypothetical protein